MKTFEGYRRANGKIGVRNHVIVINTVGELSRLAQKLADSVPGVIAVTHQAGQTEHPEDIKQTVKTIQGTAGHPNVSAVLLLGMGNKDPAEAISNHLQKSGHHVHALIVNQDQSLIDILTEGKGWLEHALDQSQRQKTVTADVSELMIGLECGGSDAWSGVTANPAIGSFTDAIVRDGGTSILAETTEAIGAEHILAERAITPEVRRDFLNKVKVYEERMKAVGEDIRSANPSPGNIAGGLTTLEEKSLGCIKKGGNSPLKEVLNYAHEPSEKGFVFMDTPGYDVESVAGLAAGGAQIVLFSTGKGSPTGSPIVPVIKIGTNTRLYENMPDHIDINAGQILEGTSTIDQIGEDIYSLVLEVASGYRTASEFNKNQEFSIWRLAETM